MAIFVVLFNFIPVPKHSLSPARNPGLSKHIVRFLATNGTWTPLGTLLKASAGSNCTSAGPRQTKPEQDNKSTEIIYND